MLRVSGHLWWGLVKASLMYRRKVLYPIIPQEFQFLVETPEIKPWVQTLHLY